MRDIDNHITRPEAGRAKIPVNFIIIFFVCLFSFALSGCNGPENQSAGTSLSGKRHHEKICLDGVEYLYLQHGYGGYMAPHFKQDGSLYLCVAVSR